MKPDQKPVQERAEEARLLLIPILKEHMVDIAPEAYLAPDGTIRARMVYTDTAPSEEPDAVAPEDKPIIKDNE